MTKPNGRPAENSLYSHQEFQQVQDHSPMGVFAIDGQGVVMYINGAAQKCINLKKNELQGRYFFDLFIDIAEEKPAEASLLRQEEITDREFKLNTQHGNERFMLISSKVHRDKIDRVHTYLFLRDISPIKKKERLFNYLNNAAEKLATARDTQSALDQISHFIVPKFADWFTIDIVKNGRIELLFLKHENPDKIEWARQYRKNYPPDPQGNTGSAYVLKTGKPGFAPVVTEEMIDAMITDPEQLKAVKQIGLQSVIIMPMASKSEITGVVNFISSTPGRHFDEADKEFAQNFANLIGLVLENARLNEEAAGELARRKQSEEQFRFLTDAIPHKMWTSGPDGRATYYNRRWYEYSGLTDFETLRAHVWEMIHPDERTIAAVEYPRAIAAGAGMEIEQRFRRYDGVYRWHLTRFTAHKDDAGQIVLWVGTSTDIHEQKLARLETEAANSQLSTANNELAAVNEELTAANEELAAIGSDNALLYEQVKILNEKKDEFIGLASHELKTPLTSISGYLQILNRMRKDDQSHKFVTRTLHQAQKLTVLVNDLLDVSKIEAGKLQLHADVFNMRKIVDDAIELIRHTNDKYKIILQTNVETCMVNADSQRIEQVLINLLTNAIKYSPGADSVIVLLSNNEQEVVIGVKDFGMGIPADKRAQIFSRFYRVEEGNPNISGLGIGLYISHEIMSRHNGRIWVEGNAERGSTFYFSLPLTKV